MLSPHKQLTRQCQSVSQLPPHRIWTRSSWQCRIYGEGRVTGMWERIHCQPAGSQPTGTTSACTYPPFCKAQEASPPSCETHINHQKRNGTSDQAKRDGRRKASSGAVMVDGDDVWL
eukprot:scaffold81804_cov34-Cyclotella_meneghiniana.AAC.1